MDDRQAFLDEIIANPDDDLPRLIYADWLEEQGDPRGEFIRLQCELDALPGPDIDWPHLTSRLMELQTAHYQEWAAGFQQNIREISFNRGFIDTIAMTTHQFLKQGERLMQSTPIEWLRLTHLKGKFEALIESSLLTQIRGLDFGRMSVDLKDLSRLLLSPRLFNLRRLNLQYAEQSLNGLGSTIANAGFAPVFRELYLRGSELDKEFFTGLASGKGFPELRHLEFGGGMSTTRPHNLKKLNVPQLESLKVGGQLRVIDCEELCHLPLTQLKHLDLSKTKLPAKGLNILSDSGVFESLESLRLESCNLSEKAGISLLQGISLQYCRSLSLADNERLGTAFAQALTTHTPLNKLESLSLLNINLDLDTLRLLANQVCLPNLKFLKVNCVSKDRDLKNVLKERYQDGINIVTPKLRLMKGWE